jgi:hypothetical protein
MFFLGEAGEVEDRGGVARSSPEGTNGRRWSSRATSASRWGEIFVDEVMAAALIDR